MQNLLGDLDYVIVYINDILITFNGSYADHLAKVGTVLKWLEMAGFCTRVNKCFFARAELEYLGYLINHNSIQPQPKKVEAVLRKKEPMTKCQLRHFLGMINYY